MSQLETWYGRDQALGQLGAGLRRQVETWRGRQIGQYEHRIGLVCAGTWKRDMYVGRSDTWRSQRAPVVPRGGGYRKEDRGVKRQVGLKSSSYGQGGTGCLRKRESVDVTF